MQLCKETQLKKFQAKMRLEHVICEIVLHSTLLYHKSYQHQGAGQVQSQFCIPYSLSEDEHLI